MPYFASIFIYVHVQMISFIALFCNYFHLSTHFNDFIHCIVLPSFSFSYMFKLFHLSHCFATISIFLTYSNFIFKLVWNIHLLSCFVGIITSTHFQIFHLLPWTCTIVSFIALKKAINEIIEHVENENGCKIKCITTERVKIITGQIIILKSCTDHNVSFLNWLKAEQHWSLSHQHTSTNTDIFGIQHSHTFSSA